MYLETPNLQKMDESKIVKNHFKHVYTLFGEDNFIELDNKYWKTVSGIQYPFHNVFFGRAKDIDSEVHYFKKKRVPFAWFIDTKEDSKYSNQLEKSGFDYAGTFKGVIGNLHKQEEPMLPEGFSIQLVDNEEDMKAFSRLICAIFEIDDYSGFYEFMWKFANIKMFHWFIKKDREIVSALSTCIDKSIMSFWNMATIESHRKKGLSSVLAKKAINHAISLKCTKGISYLMSEGMAKGIFDNLGFQHRWSFDVFLKEPD